MRITFFALLADVMLVIKYAMCTLYSYRTRTLAHRRYDVAVKSLQDKYSTNESYKRKFIDEAKIMHKLMHPHVVRLLGMCTESSPILIITELMANGALSDYLTRMGPRELPHRTLIDMIAQVCRTPLNTAYICDQTHMASTSRSYA